MARPTDPGLGYFPLDVGFLRDKKIKLIRGEFGAGATEVIIAVLSQIYEEEGYFLKWDKDWCILMSQGGVGCGKTPDYISEVIQGCVKRGFFDKAVFNVFGILTSRGIQRRYIRGKKACEIIYMAEEYWLLDIENKVDVPPSVKDCISFISVSNEKTAVNMQINSIDLQINPQSKVKESKVKESRVESVANAPPTYSSKRFIKPTLEEVKEYCLERKNNIDAEKFIDFYESKGWRIGKEQMKDWKAAVRTWEKRNNGNENKQGKIEAERRYSQEELDNIFDDIDDL